MTITTEEALAAIPEEVRERLGALPGEFEKMSAAIDKLGNLHYGYEGEPISFKTWALLFGSPTRYLRKTEIGPYVISTIWLGLDHGFGHGPPLIFETMVFRKEVSYREPREAEGDWPGMPGYHYHEDFDQRRYATQQEALADHERIVNEVSLLVAANPNWQIDGGGYAPRDTGEE